MVQQKYIFLVCDSPILEGEKAKTFILVLPISSPRKLFLLTPKGPVILLLKLKSVLIHLLPSRPYLLLLKKAGAPNTTACSYFTEDWDTGAVNAIQSQQISTVNYSVVTPSPKPFTGKLKPVTTTSSTKLAKGLGISFRAQQ